MKVKQTTFFERILQVSDYYGYRTINDFAKNGLLYASSEKINRLRNDKNKPSVDILLDISNKFEYVDLNWLLTGDGEMLKPQKDSEITLLQERLHAEMKYNRFLEEQLNSGKAVTENLLKLKDMINELKLLNKSINLNESEPKKA